MCNINAYAEAIKVFKEKDPAEMAGNAGAVYDKENKKIFLKYLHANIEVDFPSGEIISDAKWELVKNDKVLILQYLTGTTGAMPRNTWIAFIQLPGGPHHHQPFVLEAINPLAEEFGNKIEEFRKIAPLFGATEIKMGDYGVSIPVFAKLPMAVCLRQGDDEFPPSANILFDAGAPLHLTTAALWVLGVELSRKLRGVNGQQYS
ncbi:DUF3786 domain-containing protein [Thermincola potens]|uniref:DUF3786 domain-containing protein n=1 Tax=Thermincola potens (strain JR) TaxID=635013 RepID=D5X7C5_THEPJ|nr:DUF3786 domain-containing protein [Thermincola potens]ADG82495.1 conserved hypothetical protein [Thermincola potens JR]